MKPVIALDVGGTKLAAALVDPNGDIIDVIQEPTSQKGPDAGCLQIGQVVRRIVEANGLRLNQVTAIGVGVPAVLEPGTDKILWAPNIQGWRGVDLIAYLSDELGLPVFIEYDGHTAVLGEWWIGAGQGFSSFVDLIIGTGIGGGMVLDGRLYRGALRLAGAAGWLPMCRAPEHGAQHTSLDHWENLASGPGIAAAARKQAPDYPDSALFQVGEADTWTSEHIFQAAQSGDSLATRVTQQLAGLLGLGISNVISLLNPELVILGGGVGSNLGFLLPRIQEVATRWGQPAATEKAVIVCSKLGSRAGLLGAAYSALSGSACIPDGPK